MSEENIIESSEQNIAAAETELPPVVDLSDLPTPAVVQEQEQAIDYASLIEEIVAKAINQAIPNKVTQENSEEQETYDDVVTKKDLEQIKQQATEEAMRRFMEAQQHMAYINTTIKESTEVENIYKQRVAAGLQEKLNINISENPLLRDVYNYSLQQMKVAAMQELQRDKMIFTKEEMGHIVNKHWEYFSNNYLPKIGESVKVTTQGLSPAVNSTLTQTNLGNSNSDPINSFLEKRKNNKETLSDVVNLLGRFAKK